MRIKKVMPAILAIAVIILFAGQTTVKAGSNLTLWPLEPSVSAGFKTKATISGYEYDVSVDMVAATFAIRVRLGNSNDYAWFSAVAGPYGFLDDNARKQVISDFLNNNLTGYVNDIVGAICPECPAGSYIHVKRAFDDGSTTETPYMAIGDFELVINQDPPPSTWPE